MKRILAIAIGGVAILAIAIGIAAGVQLVFFAPSGDLALRGEVDLPSRLLSRPLRMQRGALLGADALEAHLEATAHRRIAADGPPAPGQYTVSDGVWRIGRRAFLHPGGRARAGVVEIALASDGRVTSLRSVSGERTRTLLIEPAVIASFHPEHGRDRRPVTLDELPRHLVDAVIATEDQRFYEHAGLDLRRIAGALVANIRAGRIVQGGSTLTQQLVKNRYLSRERSLFRKLQEIPLALWLERRHDKREILEAYLNEAYLGQSGSVAIHGVGRAAEHWFGKPAAALELHESALLAAMLRGPSLYSPWRSPKLARTRRDLVLVQMHGLGMIDEAALDEARRRDLSVVEQRRVPRSTRYFTDHVTPPLEERYGRERLRRGGLVVHTSLDLRLQRLAQRAVRRGLRRLEEHSPDLLREDAPLQAALVALDGRSGEVLAMVGGRDYGRTQWNRATDAHRQPGSVFKTVAALAALLPPRPGERPDFTLATLVEDAPLEMETAEGEWEPVNHDHEFRGPVTLREVIEHSLNVPMIRVGMAVGPRRVVRSARRLGIESPMHEVPSLVLGTSEVTLLEMTRAYGVLAARGWRAEPRPVLAVHAPDGRVLETREPAGSRALEPALAYLVTSVLRGVVDRGTGHGVRAGGFRGPVAGKTGTTDDYRDAWFIGYVPDVAIGVWVGFDDGRTLRHSGSRAALPIFTDFLNQAMSSGGGKGFPMPPGVEVASVLAAEGHPAGLLCRGRSEVFLRGSAPRERCNPWQWLAGDRRREGDDWGDARQSRADVGAGPPADGLRLHLPDWLNPFQQTGLSSDE